MIGGRASLRPQQGVGRRGERSVAAAYLVVATALIAAVLPSVLRPPPDQPNASAEFSPDAPPSDQDALVATINRATSATAGAIPVGDDAPAIDLNGGTGAAPTGPGGPTPSSLPRACPRGV